VIRAIDTFREIFYDLVGQYEYQYNRDLSKEITYDVIKDGSIVIPLYGRCRLPKHLNFLTLLPIVNRLREIKQLAYTHIFLVGATHSRLEHSLGVAHRVKGIFSKIKESTNLDLDNDDLIITQIAALLHDLGHPAWGHALDGITGYIVDLLKDVGMYLFHPEKLDIAVTTYLLLHNEQLTNGLSRICQKEITNSKYTRNFKEIIAQIIAEEEYPLFDNLAEENSLIERIHLLTTIIGAYKGRGGINLDRLDWMIRDYHHTQYHEELSKNIKEEFEKFMRDDISNSFNVRLVSKEYLDLDDSFKNKMENLRNEVYQRIYEGIERSFVDSILTRLAYSVISCIDTIGESLAGTTIRLRAIMSYLLMRDHEMIEISRKILHHTREYGHLLPLGERRDIFISFINKTVKVFSLFDRIPYLIQFLRDMDKFRLSLYEVNFKYVNIEPLNSAIFVFPPETATRLLQKIFEATTSNDTRSLADIKNLAYFCCIDVFKTLEAPRLEYNIQSEIDKKLEEMERIESLLLPNYYFFKRLNRYLKDNVKSREELFDVLEKKLTETPLLFIVFNKTIESREKWETIARIVFEAIFTHIQSLYHVGTHERSNQYL